MDEMEDIDGFVGIDWATEEHEVCVVDRRGQKIGGRSFPHSGEGLSELCDWILATALSSATHIAVVVELVRGAWIATLLERGFRVFACNPKQTDRFRDRCSPAGAKDDRLDAFVLAEAGRKDRALLREVPADDARIVEVRELVRLHNDLTRENVRLTHRLREQLQRYYPQTLQFGADVGERWRLELWKLAPSPDAAKKLRPASVRALLARHRIRRVDAGEVLAALRVPKLHVSPGVTEAATLHVEMLAPQVQLVRDQLRRIDRRLDAVLADFGASEDSSEGQESEQRDVAILRELPGAGRVVVATLLAEAWPALRARDYQQLRVLSGVAPVTQQTGKQGKSRSGPKPRVFMRRACNARLREAVWHWASAAVVHDERWKGDYAALRARGLGSARARRVIGDRLLRVLCACLRDRTHYGRKTHAAQAA